MSKASSSPDLLKQAVFELIAECRSQLPAGKADATEIERGVRAYCEALMALPKNEAQRHTSDLEALMKAVTGLGGELVAARDRIRAELGSLGRLKQANVAYQKSDAIDDNYKKKSGSE